MERDVGVGRDDANYLFGERGCSCAAFGEGLGEGEGCTLGFAISFEELQLFVGVVGEAIDRDDGGEVEAAHDGDVLLQVGKPASRSPAPWLRTDWTVVTRTAAEGLMPEQGITMSMYFSKPRSEAKPVSLTT